MVNNNPKMSDQEKYDSMRPNSKGGFVNEKGETDIPYGSFNSFKPSTGNTPYSVENTTRAAQDYLTLEQGDPAKVSKILTGEYGMWTQLNEETFGEVRDAARSISLEGILGFTTNHSKPMAKYLWDTNHKALTGLILEGPLYKDHGSKDDKFNQAIDTIHKYKQEIKDITENTREYVGSRLAKIAETDPMKATIMARINPESYLRDLVGFRVSAQVDAIEGVGAENFVVKNIKYGSESTELAGDARVKLREKDQEERVKLGTSPNEDQIKGYLEHSKERQDEFKRDFADVDKTFPSTAFALPNAVSQIAEFEKQRKAQKSA